MKLDDFFADPVRVREYKEWLQNPVTVRVVEILRELCSPLPINTDTPGDLGSQSLYYHGYNLGQSTLLNLLQGLDATSSRLAEAKRMISPDYGASLNSTIK